MTEHDSRQILDIGANKVVRQRVLAAHIREYCELDDTSTALLRSVMNQLGMSARAFHRVLKLPRTIADLAEADQLQTAHLTEAIPLRSTKTAKMTRGETVRDLSALRAG